MHPQDNRGLATRGDLHIRPCPQEVLRGCRLEAGHGEVLELKDRHGKTAFDPPAETYQLDADRLLICDDLISFNVLFLVRVGRCVTLTTELFFL